MAPFDASGKFIEFCELCDDIEANSAHSEKTNIVKDFVKDFKGDVYLICKFLVCKFDQRVYNIREKQLIKLLSRYLQCPYKDLLQDLEKGDHSKTAKDFIIRYDRDHQKKNILTLKMVDMFLEQLTTATKEDDQLDILSNFFDLCTPEEVRYVTKLMDHDLKISIGPKFVLNALHPQAYDAYKNSNDLELIVKRWQNHELDSITKGGKGSKGKFNTNVSIMTPIKPMLAKKVSNLTECFKKSPKGLFAEIKYDGERIQIHKDGKDFKCFSRNLKPVQEWKVKDVYGYIEKAAPKAESIILDGELLLMDVKTHTPLPFGTLNVHKKNDFEEATVCVFIFDICYLNGEVLLTTPIEERRKIMLKHVNVIPDHVEVSEKFEVESEDDLQKLMKKASNEGLEGIMVKSMGGPYSPNARHWFKLKKDYFDMSDTVDLVVLGAYYGKGVQARATKEGLLNVFLMGSYDKESKTWKTVCKMGNGHDEATLAKLQKDIIKNMVKIEKDPTKVPSTFDIHRQNVPDFIIKDIKKASVWEIKGASFSISDHSTHTAGLSIRFPRMERMRHDKDYKSHTNIEELHELYALDPVSYANNAANREDSPYRSPSPVRGTSPSKKVEPKKAKTKTEPKEVKKEVKEEVKEVKKEDVIKEEPKDIPKLTTKRTRKEFESEPTTLKDGNIIIHKVDEDVICSTCLSNAVKGKNIIVQCVPDSGKASSSLFTAIKQKWPKVASKYSNYNAKNYLSSMGDIQNIKVTKTDSSKLFVINSICTNENGVIIETEFKKCLKQIFGFASLKKAETHFVVDENIWESGLSSFKKIIKETESSESVKIHIYTNLDENTPVKKIQKRSDSTGSQTLTASIFKSVRAVFDGFSDKDKKKLSSIIEKCGGEVFDSWSVKNRTTHLICAEPSGTVFDNVNMLGGIIVRRDWITESFKANKRLNEIQFELTDDSDEEMPNADLSSTQNFILETVTATDLRMIETMDEETDEVETPKKPSKKKVEKVEKKVEVEVTTSITSGNFDSNTIFKGKNVFLDATNLKEAKTLSRYLIAHDCKDVSSEWHTFNSSYHVIITNSWNKNCSSALTKNSKVRILNSLWVWDCINTQKLLPTKPYMIRRTK